VTKTVRNTILATSALIGLVDLVLALILLVR